MFSQAEENIPQFLSKNLQELAGSQISDVVYLQTDKDLYFTQENLWFKSTVLDSKTNAPSNRSHILFVQLIEEKTDTPVWEEKYEIENGFVDGHLFLSDSLASGTYRLAGYSSHSYFKGQKEFYAFKKIKILKGEPQAEEDNQTDGSIHFAVFPEGGHLVSGLESRLAFKAVNTKGYSVEVSGTLYENDQALLEFETRHAGMGSFMFAPDANKTYRIQLNNQKEAKIEAFPKIQPQGKVLNYLGANHKDGYFKITQSPGQAEEKIYVRLQAKGVSSQVVVGYIKDELKLRIPIENLPQGITEVTLFDKDLKPIAERLIYANAHKKLYINAQLDKSEYQTRGKVRLKLSVTDETKTPTIAHLGLRIFGHLYKNTSDTKTIETHYLLSSQLKGRLYDPSYYFEAKNKNRNAALDLLLQTQGWRAYKWNEANLKEKGDNEPLVFDYYKGKMLNSIPNMHHIVKAFSFTGDSLKQFKPLMTNSLGRFVVTSSYFKWVEHDFLYLQGPFINEKIFPFQLNTNYYNDINNHRIKKNNHYPFTTFEKEIHEPKPFVLSSAHTRLSQVTVKVKKNRYGNKQSQKLKALLSFDYVCHLNIFNCENHVFLPNSTRPVKGRTYRLQSGTPFVYPYLPVGYNKDGLDFEVNLKEIMAQSNIKRIKGFYEKKEFYQPVYDKDYIDDGFPDKRSTLFWKPDIITNEQGEATVEFYCSDINSLYLGEIEGVSGSGQLGRTDFEFTVTKQKN
ncbi:hypothetical protein PW52_07920 [Tamlana sedimentorum]|uniref:Macroglobulin domain-containing protein n=2 Tax=Neotamlana sedimentorum TaxID=1435349 RepID=A0A0D7WAH5_9FLAO|nr:hypothetical protein PW52_07920 [Tamlana sedimentorum]